MDSHGSMDLFSGCGAAFSPCNRYRYRLWRQFDSGQGTVAFIMLNPSTATAERDDPTIRRCIGFARGWGFRRLDIGNIFAYRSTDPRGLVAVVDPVGKENDAALARLAATSDRIVCAWGAGGVLQQRGDAVRCMLSHHPLYCLGTTQLGQPKHPLYLSASASLERWP